MIPRRGANSSQIGYIYICAASSWVFFGSVNVTAPGPTGPSGPQGIGVYAATCSGGPPPTVISSPTYTCNSAFNLNMVRDTIDPTLPLTSLL